MSTTSRRNVAALRTWRLGLPLVVGLALCGVVVAADAPVNANSIALGTDFFVTGPGTFFNFGPGIGQVNFVGLPIGPGNADTIIQRQADARIGGPAIPIEMVALSLQSTSPVNVGGSFFDVFVTLDPANLNNDVGTASIGGGPSGGTFTSFLSVFFDAHFTPVSSGSPFDVFNNVSLSNGGAAWLPTPPAGAILVSGPDDGSRGDQVANLHSGLDPCGVGGVVPVPCEVDFFLSGAMTNTNGSNATDVVSLAQGPEPASIFLAAAGLAGLLVRMRRRA